MTHRQGRCEVEQWPRALKDKNFGQSKNLWARAGWGKGGTGRLQEPALTFEPRCL